MSAGLYVGFYNPPGQPWPQAPHISWVRANAAFDYLLVHNGTEAASYDVHVWYSTAKPSISGCALVIEFRSMHARSADDFVSKKLTLAPTKSRSTFVSLAAVTVKAAPGL